VTEKGEPKARWSTLDRGGSLKSVVRASWCFRWKRKPPQISSCGADSVLPDVEELAGRPNFQAEDLRLGVCSAWASHRGGLSFAIMHWSK
jgi:hypothetical protein